MTLEVRVHPRVAPPDILRVWVGVRWVNTPPQLQWEIDGQPAQPTPLRPIQSARSAQLLSGANPVRVFSGVYEFPNRRPATNYRVKVTANGASSAEIQVKTLPLELPAGVDEWFHILLVSCYHHKTSPAHALASTIEDVRKACPPSMSLLLGDQVYLDLPTIQDFPSDAPWLADKFESDYARNWFEADGYANVLAIAPSVGMPDDHEYWNNYPHVSPIIENSWTPEGRTNWKAAAGAMFTAFQAPFPTAVGDETVVDVPPVSIWAADTRTNRLKNCTQVMDSRALTRLENWVKRLNAKDLIGIFASGQSVFDKAASSFSGTVGDRALANYDDFPRIVEALVSARRPMVCLTGDVHWGRLIQMRDEFQARIAMYEIITSPTALVEQVGADQWNRVKDWWRSRVGGQPPADWPLHSPPDSQPTWQGARPSQYRTTVLHGHTGNQIAVLSLRQFGDGVQARVNYFPVHQDVRRRRPSQSAPFDLSAGLFQPFS